MVKMVDIRMQTASTIICLAPKESMFGLKSHVRILRNYMSYNGLVLYNP